jgi:hypothetical protein
LSRSWLRRESGDGNSRCARRSFTVIASEAKKSTSQQKERKNGLLRFARNDGVQISNSQDRSVVNRHCEERSDEAIHSSFRCAMDCFASLAMTAERRSFAFPRRNPPE